MFLDDRLRHYLAHQDKEDDIIGVSPRRSDWGAEQALAHLPAAFALMLAGGSLPDCGSSRRRDAGRGRPFSGSSASDIDRSLPVRDCSKPIVIPAR